MIRICFYLCTLCPFRTQEIFKLNICVVCRRKAFLANERIISPHILCLSVENSNALSYRSFKFQATAHLDFLCWPHWLSCMCDWLFIVSRTHIWSTWFWFSLFPGLLVSFLGMGNGLTQEGPMLNTSLFTATVMTSGPLQRCLSPTWMPPKGTKVCIVTAGPLLWSFRSHG